MSTESALGPLDPELFEEILADREQAYKRQGDLLWIAVGLAIVLAVAVVGVGGAAAWALTKERDHLFVMNEDPVTGLRSMVVPARPVSTKEGRQAAADQYLREAFEITQDESYNLALRGAAIEKMNASRDDKEIYYKSAIADLEANRGYVHNIDSIEFFPPDVPDPTGLKWEAQLVLKIQDLREGIGATDPVRFDRYMISVIMKEVKPSVESPRNLAGLIFLPVAPRPIPEKSNATRG